MTSAARKGRPHRSLLRLEACLRCGYDLTAIRPDQRCPECGFDYGVATPRVPVWPRRVWLADRVLITCAVMAPLSLAVMLISLAVGENPGVWMISVLLFSAPFFYLGRRRIQQDRGSSAHWIAICPSGLVRGGLKRFAPRAERWSAYREHLLARQAANRRRLTLSPHRRKASLSRRVDVEVLLTDEQAVAFQREIAAHLDASRGSGDEDTTGENESGRDDR